MSGDLVFAAGFAAFTCLIFALEPIFKLVRRHFHRDDHIDVPWGKERLGR